MLKSKTCKRGCLPKYTTDRKYAAKMEDRMTKDKNGQLVTRDKSKRADSGNKAIVTNKSYRKLTVLCFEIPASSQPEIGK